MLQTVLQLMVGISFLLKFLTDFLEFRRVFRGVTLGIDIINIGSAIDKVIPDSLLNFYTA
jgi:hypothetical protein